MMSKGFHQDALDDACEIKVPRAAPSTDTPAEITRDAAPGSTPEGSPSLRGRLTQMRHEIVEAVKKCLPHKGEIVGVTAIITAASVFVATRDAPPDRRHDEMDGVGKMFAERADAAYWKAMTLQKNGKVGEAISVLESAEPTEKNFLLRYRLHKERYQMHKQKEDVEAQVSTLRGALARSPSSTHISHLLAAVFEEEGQTDEAIKILEEAVPHAKGNKDNKVNKVLHQDLVLRIVSLLESQGRRDEATQRLRKAGSDLAYWSQEREKQKVESDSVP